MKLSITNDLYKKGKRVEILGTPSLVGIRQAAKNSCNKQSLLRFANFDVYFGKLKTRITKIDECSGYVCKIEAEVLDFDNNIIARVKGSVSTALYNMGMVPKGVLEFY